MKTVKILYFVAGIYNIIIGGIFLAAPSQMFDLLGVGHPNHWGYANFPSLTVLILAVMFFNISKNPQANRNMMPYAIMFKAASCLVIFGYSWLVIGGIPMIWLAFGLIDAIFFGHFTSVYFRMKSGKA